MSEIMLQQTTVATVIPRFEAWMHRFPTLQSLAKAEESEVLHAWQGLGYYARARNLRRCAQLTRALPRDPLQLRGLPGIGRYTANAISIFAFDQPLPLVEANGARVLSRVFNIRAAIDSTAGQQQLWSASAQLVPKSYARDFHNALMDLGALVCTPRKPHCGICPIRKFCRAPNPHLLPVKRRRPDLVSLIEPHAFITRRTSVLLSQCQRRWRGMWMLPRARVQRGEPIYTASFPFTHHRIMLRVFERPVRSPGPHEHWFCFSDVTSIPMPTPHRRAIERCVRDLRQRRCAREIDDRLWPRRSGMRRRQSERRA
ncbi:MAG: A/G-specific adenine glycosylase [Verrucomicrobia bacterium]|nr:A/G-specific adenine glycosylase [Verrucomicrobiota bacterium]